MARRNALVRRLPAVETLGCAQVICTDKTGTLTVGEMTVRKLVTGDARLPRDRRGLRDRAGRSSPTARRRRAGGRRSARAARAPRPPATMPSWRSDGRHGPAIVGDPTEGALLVAAAKARHHARRIERATCRGCARLPFDSGPQAHDASSGGADGRRWAFVKGAPEVILERCTRDPDGRGGAEVRSADARARAHARGQRAARRRRAARARPRRARRSTPAGGRRRRVESDLTFLGLVGMQDPPRPRRARRSRRCQRAGIRTVMITGDHPATAARDRPRARHPREPRDERARRAELDRMADDELRRAGRGEVAVYARVTAEHKLRIVRAWKARGAVVAMTGDGVNDAPALKEASIGIAMGMTGTEVTKEAADIVITDDNFASIVAAVEEGRGIYDNIAKTLGVPARGQRRRADRHAGRRPARLAAAAAADPAPLDQPRHRRPAGAGPRRPIRSIRRVLAARRAVRTPRCSTARLMRRVVLIGVSDRRRHARSPSRAELAPRRPRGSAQRRLLGARVRGAVPHLQRPQRHEDRLGGRPVLEPPAARRRCRDVRTPARHAPRAGHGERSSGAGP